MFVVSQTSGETDESVIADDPLERLSLSCGSWAPGQDLIKTEFQHQHVTPEARDGSRGSRYISQRGSFWNTTMLISRMRVIRTHRYARYRFHASLKKPAIDDIRGSHVITERHECSRRSVRVTSGHHTGTKHRSRHIQPHHEYTGEYENGFEVCSAQHCHTYKSHVDLASAP